MKKIFFFVFFIFSFDFAFGQIQYSPEKCISFWKAELSKKEIQSMNTSIQEYSLFGERYFLVAGEEGFNIDPRPLLVKPVDNKLGFIEIQNLYPEPGNAAPDSELIKEMRKKNTIEILRGCFVVRVHFFSEAKLIGFIWKKFPNADYWNWQY